jgi:predicted ribosome quality control (RQC) complex YloA/Tae2 family protein
MSSKGKPFRTFDVEGWEVLVGRSDDDNEVLTFVIAEKNDWWLHVAGGKPGSHVVIRNPNDALVPKHIMDKAGQLAAWYSNARSASKVEVHVCRVADVLKPRGAPRGQVQLRRFSSIKVKPDRLDDESGA